VEAALDDDRRHDQRELVDEPLGERLTGDVRIARALQDVLLAARVQDRHREVTPVDLEIRQHKRFQQREWRLERVGWGLIAVFVLAGLLGLVGPGPLSTATARSDGGLVEVQYQRFTHWIADDTVEIHVAADAVQADTFEVTLTGDWVQSADLNAITPEPSEQRSTPQGIVLEIPVEDPAGADVQLSFRATSIGPLHATVTAGSESAQFSQFVWP
jgi:hypothetical protein